jgi:tagatose-6-phosphate ketose/aldose isomerase
MHALDALIKLDANEKSRLGAVHTPGEIAQQPQAWRETYEIIAAQQGEVQHFVNSALAQPANSAAHLAGAGTSHFVGESVRNVLAAGWQTAVSPIASTEIVLSPETLISPQAKLLVSFARSGQSPEGNTALQMVNALRPDIYHLAVTCNRTGELARLAKDLGPQGYAIVLPDMTNDKGLAMTSSYSSMVVAAQVLASLPNLAAYELILQQLVTAGEHVMAHYADEAKRIAGLGFSRAVYIGNRDLYGVALESHLKMQEMTAGRVLCKAESTLGLRHGPMAAMDEQTLVVMFMSSDPYVRQYEMDLLRGIADQKLGQARVVITDHTSADIEACADLVVELAPNRQPISDLYKAPAAIIFPQLLALFRSLAEGLSPDAPSPGGVIHRVVQGVRIYPYTK